MRTLPTFFGVLELLLRAGVTTVAEAAFQDRVWSPGLEPLQSLAQIRVVHCTVHADLGDAAEHALRHNAFDRVSANAPWIEVDTTDGCRPGLRKIVAFASGQD